MEIWKDIKGFEGIYKISNTGYVKSLARVCGTCHRKEKILADRITKDGYKHVRLQNGKITKDCRNHRLVAEAFIPNPLNLETVNHIDGNKLNNDVSNLEWMNRSDQMVHAYKLGLKHPVLGKKFSTSDLQYIRDVYVKGSREYGSVALSKKFNCCHSEILNIVKGKSYK